MLELAQEILEGEEAWVVGGAVRDELLGRPVVGSLKPPRAGTPAVRRAL